MGWSIGYDHNWNRDIGYGVPATCDHPGCGRKIDRGLAHVCGGEPYGGDHGCGLYFCGSHIFLGGERPHACERCRDAKEDDEVTPFDPTPDRRVWLRHKLRHHSWKQWRDENAKEVAEIKAALDKPRSSKAKKMESA